ncbi:ly6/PLAUR domain-containing protein 3-like [Dendropsophus ebraccatus]|uniref:ly6/PLAUR domain-containing protein 3-like n=1 Tax=Dendropsophus ebraccatus TaxID=150705 RepID=UPI003831E1FC
MERIFGLPWTGSALLVVCLVFTFRLKDVTSQSLECYSCTDRGDGGCLPANAVNVSCSEDQDVCLETLSGIKTSHENHIILKKGCGYSVAAKMDKTIYFHGISIFIRLNECNSSLCNSNMDLKDYELAADDNTDRVPNEEQCYSCIGRPHEECSPSHAPTMTCYDTYSHCFDGNVAISIGNDTTVIPVKSCTLRFRCAVQTVAYGSASYEIKGACCSGKLCNQDLSNKTQLVEVPFLELFDDNNEELPTTAAPAPWVTPKRKLATTKAVLRDGERQVTPNSTVSSRSSNQLQDGQTKNAAFRLVYAPWLISILTYLL